MPELPGLPSDPDRVRFHATLLDAVGEAVIATDIDGRVLYWNGAAERLYGWSAEEALGRPIMALTPSQQSAEQRAEILACLRRGEKWSGELVARRKDGSTFPAQVVDSPLLDAQGTPIGIVGISIDLTARKALDVQLRQTQRMEAVGRLAGGIAHDFNNLLTIIQCNAQLLDLDLKDEGMRHNLAEIEGAASRAAELTRQLLAFSRQQLLQTSTLDLGALVSEMVDVLRRLLGERCELRIRATDDLGSIDADPAQVAQVVMCLAMNARDAMPDGGVLDITLQNAALDASVNETLPYDVRVGPYVLLSVRDSGTGMDETTLLRMFEPFFTTKGRESGTGMGLPMVYGIVKQSGGYIWVDSAPGEGTNFRIYFPLLVASAGDAAGDAPTDAHADAPTDAHADAPTDAPADAPADAPDSGPQA